MLPISFLMLCLTRLCVACLTAALSVLEELGTSIFGVSHNQYISLGNNVIIERVSEG